PFAADCAQSAGSLRFRRLKISHAFQCRVGRRIQVGGPADDVWNFPGECVESFPTGNPRGNRFVSWFPSGKIILPVPGKLSARYQVEFCGLFWKFLPVSLDFFLPSFLCLCTLADCLTKMIHGLRGQVELIHSRPAESFLGSLQFFFSQGVSMGG